MAQHMPMGLQLMALSGIQVADMEGLLSLMEWMIILKSLVIAALTPVISRFLCGYTLILSQGGRILCQSIRMSRHRDTLYSRMHPII